MVGILPLLFALVVASSLQTTAAPAWPQWGLPAWSVSVVVVAASLLGWIGLNAAIGRWARRRGPPEHEYRAQNWDRLGTVAALVIYVLWCRYAGWAAVSAWGALQVLPMAALLLPVWRTAALLALGDRPAAADASLLNRLRFGILPGLLAILLFDLLSLLVIEPLLVPLEAGDQAWWTPLLLLAIVLAGPLLVLGALPPILVRLWRARPMPAGPHRDLLEQGCRAAGIRADRIWHWPAAGGRFHNAAVLGLFPRWRYVLFSDDLLADLPPRQLLAVLGHELGHIRHRHLLLMLAFLLAASGYATLAAEPILAALTGRVALDGQLLEVAVLLGLFVLVLWVGFGILSRACERQADLAGARLVGDPGVMREALQSVALLSGQHPEAPSWRHGSIASRMAYLAEVERDPRRGLDHHRRVRWLTWGILMLLILLPLMALQFSRPAAADGEWFAAHPQAESAWAAAGAGQPERLRAWLRGVEPADRFPLAALALQEVGIDLGSGALRDEITEAELLARSHRQRHRLMILGLVGTGEPGLDVMLLNLGTYAAVAARRELAPLDRELSWEALPELYDAAYDQASHALHDTVGCIYHVHDHHDLAAEHYRLALDLLAKNERVDAGSRPEIRSLYARRLSAAESAAPLPLDPHAGVDDPGSADASGEPGATAHEASAPPPPTTPDDTTP